MKSAGAVKNICTILQKYGEEEIVVVVSAMGKTTNAMEAIVETYMEQEQDKLRDLLGELKAYHLTILEGLFEQAAHGVYADVELLFTELQSDLEKEPSLNYDFDYDRLIGYGELLSTTIIAHYLNEAGLATRWMDIRKSLKTDNTWREGRVDWELSARLVREHFSFQGERILLTQGFLASTINGQPTSLGRYY